ncbi:topoisomerase DNA-binding C4 zinc finger domain-containing protein [Brevibacillus fulvus]
MKICPACGGKLTQRHGRYGSFVGCSNFPSCRYVVKNTSSR